MECPNCKLVNPPTAMRCDCGYDFQGDTNRTTQESYLESINHKIQTGWPFLFAIWFLLLAPWFYILGLTGMMWDSGNPLKVGERAFIASIVTYPVMLVISLTFRRKLPALVLLPLLNVGVFVVLVAASK